MRSIAIGLALWVMVVLSACGQSDSRTPRAADRELDRARSFDHYTLYYLGNSFRGLRLTDVLARPEFGHETWDFIYGNCTPTGGEQPSCPPPLDIQNWSVCARFAAIYPGRTPKTSPVGGAETLPAGGGLDVYTGRTTVVIFGGGTTAVIHSLRRVSDDIKPDTLPEPVSGSLGGHLPCQAPALRRVAH
ncbi:MAG: hypothetical protein ACRDMH_01135 [Solirubrobacterales bacterium]